MTNACPRSDLTPAKAGRTSAASTAIGAATLPKSATLRSGTGRGTVTIRDRVPALETATVAADTATVDQAATTIGTETTIVAAGVVDGRHLAAVAETAFPVSAIAEGTVTIVGTMTLADADTEAVVVMVTETVRTRGEEVRRTHARAMAVSIGAGETTRGETAETRVGRGRLQDGVIERSDTAGVGEATQNLARHSTRGGKREVGGRASGKSSRSDTRRQLTSIDKKTRGACSRSTSSE